MPHETHLEESVVEESEGIMNVPIAQFVHRTVPAVALCDAMEQEEHWLVLPVEYKPP